MIIASEILLNRILFKFVVLISLLFASFMFFLIYVLISVNGKEIFSFENFPMLVFLTYMALAYPIVLAIIKEKYIFNEDYLLVKCFLGLFSFRYSYKNISYKDVIIQNNNKSFVIKLENGQHLVFFEKAYINYWEFYEVVKSKSIIDASLTPKNYIPKGLKIFLGLGGLILLLVIISLKMEGYW